MTCTSPGFASLMFGIVVLMLRSCMVHVSNYRDGEWHEENLDLEMPQHKQKKKGGQLHFAIMVEENITQTFDDNPSVGGVSSQVNVT